MLVRSACCAIALIATALPATAEEWLLGNPLRHAGETDPAAPSISFTPRLPGVIDLGEAEFRLSYGPVSDDFSGLSGDARGFAVGGALDLQGLSISARVVQAADGYAQFDEVDASISVGATTAFGSYREVDSGGGQASSRFALGADLAAAPGVSVGAGLAYEDRSDGGSADDATGLVRFRLAF